MKMKPIFLIALVGALWSGGAAAVTDKFLGYAGAQYEFMNPDSRRDAEQAHGVRLFGGFPIVDYASLEFSLSYLKSDLKFGSGLDDKMLGYGLDLNLSPWRGPVTPYMLIGGGGVRDKIDGGSVTNGYIDGGVGVWVRIWEGIFARAEVRREAVFGGGPVDNAKTLNDTHFGIGLQYIWIRQAPHAEPVSVARVAPPPPPDPCQTDSDHDGVPDCRDKCPDTPPGFKVDANGCIEEKQTVILLNGVLFALNSSDLKPEAAQELDKDVAGLKAQPTLKLEVGGHTCNIGTEAYNLALSRRRANAVRDYLIAHGIDGSRLTAEGYGEFSPVASNDTDEGRQKNRRVEFRVLQK